MIAEKKRLHSFDNFRALLAILGIPFHVALYLYVYHLSLKHIDINYFHLPSFLHSVGLASLFLLVFYIHVFRMPAFFMLSGFFSHMIYTKKTFSVFVKSRLVRIGVPFLAFIVLLIPFGLMPLFLVALQQHADFSAILAQQYHAHLLWGYCNHVFNYWFLYYLLWFLFFSVFLLGLFRSLPIQKSIRLSPKWLIFFILFISILCLLLSGYWYPVTQNPTFSPNDALMLFYGVWYFLGWCLWADKNLLDFCLKNAWMKMFFSFLAYFIYLLLYQQLFHQDNQYLYFLAITLYCLSMMTGVFGVLGLVHRYFNFHNSMMTYLVRASYWIYLVQIPFLTILFPLLVSIPVSIVLQFLIGVVVCFMCCILSFEICVSGTALFKIIG